MMKQLFWVTIFFSSTLFYAMEYIIIDEESLRCFRMQVATATKETDEYHKSERPFYTYTNSCAQIKRLLEVYHKDLVVGIELNGLLKSLDICTQRVQEYETRKASEQTGLRCLVATQGIELSDIDRLNALYQGMLQAKQLHEKIKAQPEIQTLLKKVQARKEMACKEFEMMVAQKTAQELDKDEEHKAFASMIVAGHAACIAAYEYALILPDDPDYENNRIKKLTAFYMSGALAEKTIQEITKIEKK